MTEALTERNAVLTGGIEGEDFAKVFNDLFAHPEKIEELSRGSLKVAKSLDSVAMAKKLEKLYQSLIETQRNLK